MKELVETVVSTEQQHYDQFAEVFRTYELKLSGC